MNNIYPYIVHFTNTCSANSILEDGRIFFSESHTDVLDARAGGLILPDEQLSTYATCLNSKAKHYNKDIVKFFAIAASNLKEMMKMAGQNNIPQAALVNGTSLINFIQDNPKLKHTCLVRGSLEIICDPMHIACFSSVNSAKKILMWEKYADAHFGVCIVFRADKIAKDTLKSRSGISFAPVTYQNWRNYYGLDPITFFTYTLATTTEGLNLSFGQFRTWLRIHNPELDKYIGTYVSGLATIKSQEYSYEEEVRFMCNLENVNPPHVKFDKISDVEAILVGRNYFDREACTPTKPIKYDTKCMQLRNDLNVIKDEQRQIGNIALQTLIKNNYKDKIYAAALTGTHRTMDFYKLDSSGKKMLNNKFDIEAYNVPISFSYDK